jgi:uncharacterized protein (TIGR04255 family)
VAGVQERIRDRYPKVVERQKIQAQLKLEGGKLVADTTPLGQRGHFFRTDDERTIVQFRSDGFTLNRLQPYTSWGELFPEALRLWELYVDASGVESVARLALRYINHLRIPWTEGEEFGVYMLAAPTLPEPIPQAISTFLTRYGAHDPKAEIGINIAQRLKPGSQGGLLLDIDVYKTGPFAARERTLIQQVFEVLHEMKNRIFFNMVTEKCLQLFQ